MAWSGAQHRPYSIHEHLADLSAEALRAKVEAAAGGEGGPCSQKKTRCSVRLCAAVHARPLTKYGFVHASLSIVRGARTETAAVPCAGEPVRGSIKCEYVRPSAQKNLS